MRMPLALCALILSVTSLCNEAYGSDQPQIYSSLAGKSCAAFVHDKNNNEVLSLMYSSWVAGFVTSQNIERFKHYSIVNKTNKGKFVNLLEYSDLFGALAWLENYCNSNPLSQFSVAVIELINFLNNKNPLEFHECDLMPDKCR